MLTIYRKQIQKNWIYWSLPTALMVPFALLMVLLWPEIESMVQSFEELLNNPIYQALLGEGGVELGITSFEGFISLELFIMGDIIFMALILLFGVGSIVREVDNGTLDMLLSFPIPRWKLLLEKLFAYITVTLAFPILVWLTAVIGTTTLNIEFNYGAFLLALLSRWILYMTLSCIVILCSLIFMDSGKTLGSAGLIIGGSYIFERIGGLVRTASAETADILQGISIFHYLDGPTVMNAIINETGFPLADLALVGIIGIGALVASLVVFQRREFK